MSQVAKLAIIALFALPYGVVSVDAGTVKIMPMAGPEGVATLVPRDFNHPPLGGYKVAKAHVVSFQPGDDVTLRFEVLQRDS